MLKLVLAAVFSTTLSAPVPPQPDVHPAPRFENVTSKVGLPTRHTMSWGSLFADYNRNGYPDLFVNRHFWRPWLFENKGGRFSLHSEDFYPRRIDRHNCAWGEANGDRRVDLYCVAGAELGEGRDPNQLFLQQRNGSFRNRARRYGVRYGPGRGRTTHWIDYDGDGDLDLIATNAPRDGFPNVLFRNDGGGSFTRARAGIEDHLRTASSSWADWNRDGRPDLLVLQHRGPIVAYENTGGRFRRVDLPGVTTRPGRWLSAAWGDYDGDGWPDLHLVGHSRSLVLRNDQGTFRMAHDIPLERGRTSVWFDVNNNGRLDLYVVQGAHNETDSINHRNFMIVQGEEGFEVVRHRSFRGPRVGNGDGVAAADYDRDGRVDLFVTNGHRPQRWRGPSLLLRNRTEALNWVGVELKGPRGNPWGIGARIRVQAGMLDYWRHVTDGMTARAQSEVGYQHLGIGRNTFAQVRIEWPDGTEDCLSISTREIADVRRGSNPC